MKDVLRDHFAGIVFASLAFGSPRPVAWLATALFVGYLVRSLDDLQRWSVDVDERHLAENRTRKPDAA